MIWATLFGGNWLNHPHNPLYPVKNQSSQATVPPNHTCTHCPLSANSFSYCETKRPELERSQQKGTIHWGSEKSLTEAICFPSQRESLFFTPAFLHSASCRNCTTPCSSSTWGSEKENKCSDDLTLLLWHLWFNTEKRMKTESVRFNIFFFSWQQASYRILDDGSC